MEDFIPRDRAPTTVGEALDACSAALDRAGVYFGHGTDNAWDEAVQLVLHVADLPVDAGDEVLPHPLSARQLERLRALLQRRIGERTPLPYLLGRAWFAGLCLRCDPRAIVPRSPIGELVLDGFSPWYSGPPPRRVLDLCCGGGALGLAVAHHMPGVRVDLLDIDPDALALAAENAADLGLASRVRPLQSDLFAALDDERYDIVLCNPPYVNAADLAAMPREYRAEPALALGSGVDGLQISRRVLARAGEFLTPGGLLLLEVGTNWPALERAYPSVPFTWVEFEHGGEGVCAMTAGEWQDYSASFR